jgi:hypothetical protein
LERRLTGLIKRRRRIEALKSELASAVVPDEKLRLQASLARHEQEYQERATALRRGRQKLRRRQEELRLMKQ